MAPKSPSSDERFERFACIQILRGKLLAFARKLSPQSIHTENGLL